MRLCCFFMLLLYNILLLLENLLTDKMDEIFDLGTLNIPTDCISSTINFDIGKAVIDAEASLTSLTFDTPSLAIAQPGFIYCTGTKRCMDRSNDDVNWVCTNCRFQLYWNCECGTRIPSTSNICQVCFDVRKKGVKCLQCKFINSAITTQCVSCSHQIQWDCKTCNILYKTNKCNKCKKTIACS